MNIIVLNGSPKGEVSTTMQYIKYLANNYEEHDFDIQSVAQSIRKLESDKTTWEELISRIEAADIVMWAFPLYILSVHASYKRFIELIFERKAQKAFKDKYTAALSTSIKFFDYTAHEYIHGICDDLKMNYCGYYSAHMLDLLNEAERKRLRLFLEETVSMKQANEPLPRSYQPLDYSGCINYKNEEVEAAAQLSGKRAVIVADTLEEGQSIEQMVRHMQNSFEPKADVIELSKIDMKGGCTGCLKCGYENICDYDGKDEVRPTYEKIQQYDILIFAGAIKDRHLSSLWKQFYDRRFFNTHQPMLERKQMAFLISGPLAQLAYMSHTLVSFVQFDDSNLSGIVTDEAKKQDEISRQIEGLAQRMVRQSASGYIQPMPGQATAGRTVFRDHVWGGLRFVFRGDHKYYKKHGWYDFPQKDYSKRIMTSIMIFLQKFKFFRGYVQDNMKTLMLRDLAPIAEKKEKMTE